MLPVVSGINSRLLSVNSALISPIPTHPIPEWHFLHSHHPSPHHSFVPGLKPSFSVNRSHSSLPLLLRDWLHGRDIGTGEAGEAATSPTLGPLEQGSPGSLSMLQTDGDDYLQVEVTSIRLFLLYTKLTKLVDFYDITGVVLISYCLVEASDSWYKCTWAHRA